MKQAKKEPLGEGPSGSKRGIVRETSQRTAANTIGSPFIRQDLIQNEKRGHDL
jgi:hypothetical protein